MKKRIISLILAVMMIASILPLSAITAFAAEQTYTPYDCVLFK